MMLEDNREKIWNNNQKLWNQLENKRIFVTGGTGFFGKSLLDLILYFNIRKNFNLNVILLIRNPAKFITESPELASNEWTKIQQGDIVDFKFENWQIDYILHFANPANSKLNQESPIEIFDIITNGTRHILEYAKFSNASGLLQTSTGAVYGKQPSSLSHITEDYLGAPQTNDLNSGYAEGKRVAELIGNIYASKFGFEHKIARCFAFIGPYLDINGSYAIGNFIRDVAISKKLTIMGDGRDFRSYMYSDDLIHAIFSILIFGKNQQPYNVGSEDRISISNLAQTVAKSLNSKLPIEIQKEIDHSTLPNQYVPSIQLLKTIYNSEDMVDLDSAIKKSTKNLIK